MKNTYRAGLFAEWLARQYLRLRGFRILESRYVTGRFTGRAEIDIIAAKRDLILFVEVKNRPNAMAGLEAISYEQHERLRAAAETYLRRKRSLLPARFDAIVVSGLKIVWLKNVV
ncbi:MAG: YraN family protein [Rickettsiales bacterium]|jgi:putative endonuclease|nr:YraN family protein [Rickettsiales bacterium]